MKKAVQVPGPIDLEGHKGTDGRYYLLDFSRLFPPDILNKKYPCGLLYRLFRPELVKKSTVPLCSDSLSKFIANFKTESAEYRMNIYETHEYLSNEIIPDFSNMLKAQKVRQFTYLDLIHSMHREGINLRYLGKIRSLIKNTGWGDILLIEALSRTIKWNLREKLRKRSERHTRLPSILPFKEELVDYLNLIFSNTKISKDFWDMTLIPNCLYKFQDIFSDNEIHTLSILNRFFLQNSEDSESSILTSSTTSVLNSSSYLPAPGMDKLHDAEGGYLMNQLFIRLSQLIGVEFTKIALKEFTSNRNSFNSQKPFDIIHIRDFVPISKNLTVFERTNGLLLQINSKLSKDQIYSKQLLLLSISSFQKALECNPSDKSSLLQSAIVYSKLKLNDRANHFFQLALYVDDSDPVTCYYYGKHLHFGYSDFVEAERYYLQALENSPATEKYLYYYCKLLFDMNNKDICFSLLQQLTTSTSSSKFNRKAKDLLNKL